MNESNIHEFEVDKLTHASGYGVYRPSLINESRELILICNSSNNAHLIKTILDCDASGVDYKEVGNLDATDIANSNILNYIDEIYQSKVIQIKEDKHRNPHITISGLGRLKEPTLDEMITLAKMKVTNKILLTRKIGFFTLWSIAI